MKPKLNTLLFSLLGLFLSMRADCTLADIAAATEQRRALIKELQAMGIENREVLGALLKVPRHEFVPAELRPSAYRNHPLPIGQGQTISQPYIVAYMTEALQLKKGEKVLEIGTGSGYQAAVLAELGAKVFSIEIIAELSKRAADVLKRLGYNDIQFKVGDGYLGWPEEAPFDAIMITAAAPKVPQTLVEQLKDGGRMILPLGKYGQKLVMLRKSGAKTSQHSLLPVVFVPMTGKVRDTQK